MSASTYTSSARLVDNAEPYVNISESINPEEHHFVKGAYTFDNIPSTVGLRNVLTSAHRLSFIYGLDGERVSALGTKILFPAGSTNSPPSQVQLPIGDEQVNGYLIPFSMAIMGVYASGYDTVAAPAAQTPITGMTLTFHVKTNAGTTVDTLTPSIWHMPLIVTAVAGGWRWCANDLNFSGADSKEIPLIYLPSDYATAGTKWWLTAEINNTNAALDIELDVNVMVEVAFLQSNDIAT
jgi:hypothetical protein